MLFSEGRIRTPPDPGRQHSIFDRTARNALNVSVFERPASSISTNWRLISFLSNVFILKKRVKAANPLPAAILAVVPRRKQKAASTRRWKRPRHWPQWSNQCTNRAIRMMIGIGTPRKNSSNERMVMLLV
jgi:hypothetical protein